MTGKHQGEIGVIIGIETTGRALVQIPGLPYERSYDKEHLEFRGRIEPQLTTGESRRKKQAALIRAGRLCSAYPHVCHGSCENTEETVEEQNG
jgi:hypothetical protein